MDIEIFWACYTCYVIGVEHLHSIYDSLTFAQSQMSGFKGAISFEQVYGIRIEDKILVLGKVNDCLTLKSEGL